ncbi:DUF771 domain-containing protein [Staphylococcus auricularis]|uniref:DUF771 domain-containing protein n=1 Tax=Staphylococcus auricularis TaxID=29379 RepID=A0AAW7M3L0_9STAP|nr:DUF771 domain-containing protein [Staphylococcus auricularis]MDC6328250.1 DUF771 domain-containing protein [Staphylococcus auricularis]MDN4532159.1 DUF771 domain-containing protein [Staphylococcus auricularis]
MSQILNVQIKIPDEYVLIETNRLKELEENIEDPIWDMKDLKNKTKMASDTTIQDRLLYNPKFRKELKNKGIVHYPDDEFRRWRVNAKKMTQFLEENFEDIFNKE